LYEVTLPAGTLRRIAATSTSLLDIALLGDTLYGTLGDHRLYGVDRSNAALTPLATLTTGGFNALDIAPDGTLYGAGGASVHAIDRATGATTLAVPLPSGHASSGDLAFVQGSLFVSTFDGSLSDALVHVDLGTGASTVVGPIGFNCVYGLAEFGAKLYGFT